MDDNELLGYAALIEVIAIALAVTGGGFVSVGSLLSVVMSGPQPLAFATVGGVIAGAGGFLWRLTTTKLSE